MSQADGVVKFIRGAAGVTSDAPDAELVRRFAAGGDEAAFRALVGRYGPLVWAVCRRLVRDRHAAEDAFQATLLVFARKAGTLRADAAVGGWLHAVAWRVAARVRADTRRAEPTEADPADAAPGPLAELTVREAETALHDELARLPEQYRAPLILCCLDGLSRDEAAARLGWPVNRVKHGLEQGRERLRARLARRGIAPGVLLLTGMLASPASAAPPPLVETAVACAAGSAAPPTAVHLLATGVIRTMFVAKWKWAALCCAVVLVGGGALAAVVRPAPEAKPVGAPVLAPVAEARPTRAAPEPKPEPKPAPIKFPADVAVEYLSAIANGMPEKALKMGDDLAKHVREIQTAGTAPTDLTLVLLNDLHALAVTKRAKLKRRPNADPTDEHVVVELERKDLKSPWRVRGNDVADEKKVLRETDDYLEGKFDVKPDPTKANERARMVPPPWRVADEFLTLSLAEKTADALKLVVPGTISEKKVGELRHAGEVGKPVAVMLNVGRAEIAYELRPREEGVTKPMYLVLMLTQKGEDPWRVKDIDARDRDTLRPRLEAYLAGKYDTPAKK